MDIKDTWPITIYLLFPNLELLVKSDHQFLGDKVSLTKPPDGKQY